MHWNQQIELRSQKIVYPALSTCFDRINAVTVHDSNGIANLLLVIESPELSPVVTSAPVTDTSMLEVIQLASDIAVQPGEAIVEIVALSDCKASARHSHIRFHPTEL